jgi:hypothetical protein
MGMIASPKGQSFGAPDRSAKALATKAKRQKDALQRADAKERRDNRRQLVLEQTRGSDANPDTETEERN